MIEIINCHTHVFTINDVPRNFLIPGLATMLRFGIVRRPLVSASDLLWPLSRSDKLSRYASFIRITYKKTQRQVFDLLRQHYPENTRFVLLSMDMRWMGAGAIDRPFEAQLDQLAEIKRAFPDQAIPFIAVDPRRDNIADLVKRYIEDHGFGGIKLYPALGFWPFDPRLDAVYEYAEKEKIPIIVHGSRGGVYYQARVSKKWLKHPKTGASIPRQPNSRLMNVLSDPDNYDEYVLKRFPRLKLCFGHFGGHQEWTSYLEDPWEREEATQENWVHKIRTLIAKYDNVYTDVSYTLGEDPIVPLLKMFLLDEKLRKRILFGTDFYMLENVAAERKVSIDFRFAIGEEHFRTLAVENPRAFISR